MCEVCLYAVCFFVCDMENVKVCMCVCRMCAVCVCIVCVVCLCMCRVCKRDTEAHGQDVLECLEHVRKPGWVLKLTCLLGETMTLSGCPLWAVVWTNLSYSGTAQAPTHLCPPSPERRVACAFKRRKLPVPY